MVIFCFFKQKTAYEMRISDWSSDVCSSDLPLVPSSSKSGARPHSRLQLQYSWHEYSAPPAKDLDVFAMVDIHVIGCSGLLKFDTFHSPSPYCVVQDRKSVV